MKADYYVYIWKIKELLPIPKYWITKYWLLNIEFSNCYCILPLFDFESAPNSLNKGKYNMTAWFAIMMALSDFLTLHYISFIKLSLSSKFHDNSISGSSVT